MIKTKRVYEEYSKNDGFRILIDRLWPRGISKNRAKIDLWIKDVAPSNDLRRWYSYNPENTQEFQKRYLAELKSKDDSLKEIKKIVEKQKTITFLYASKNTNPVHGIVLKTALTD